MRRFSTHLLTRIPALTLLGAMLLLGSPGAADLLASDPPASTTASAGCQEHPPILIVGDEGPLGLTATDPVTGETGPRPGSGVVAGSGTPEDPYVIQGWCIQSGLPSLAAAPIPPPPDGITIRDTTAHLTIQENVVVGWRDGIRLEGTDNVAIQANRIEDPDDVGIRIVGGEALTINGNELSGGTYAINVQDAMDLEVRQNTITNPAYGISVGHVANVEITGNELVTDQLSKQAIQTDEASETLVENNAVDGFHTGVYVVESHEIVVRGNQLASFMRGVNLWFTDDALIEGQVIDGPDGWGVVLVDSNRNTIRDNQIRGANHGVDLRGSGQDADNLVIDNVIEANTVGVATGNTGAHEMRSNTVTGNEVGMRFSNAAGHTVESNEITANEIGVEFIGTSASATMRSNTITGNTDGLGLSVDLDVDVASDVDARWNWWGCPEGPLDPACDDVQGDALYDPWSTSP